MKMEAAELESYLAREGLRHRVTSADLLPSAVKRPEGLIVNTDPARRPGTHWVAFYLPGRGPVEFFDSMGFPPEHYHPSFRNFLILHGPEYLHNSGRIQDYGSAVCGAYCLDYLTRRDRGVDFRTYLKEWGCDYALNDSEVLRRVCLGNKNH